MKKITYMVIVLAIVVGGIYLFKNSVKTDTNTTIDAVSDLIVVEAPLSGAMVTSPLLVSGQARGNWYFEGSFPIEIVAVDGTVIGQEIATAQGEWMTEEFVPFTASISFTAPTGDVKSGMLILKKNNPSGLPENDDSISIPIQFD